MAVEPKACDKSLSNSSMKALVTSSLAAWPCVPHVQEDRIRFAFRSGFPEPPPPPRVPRFESELEASLSDLRPRVPSISLQRNLLAFVGVCSGWRVLIVRS